MVTMSINISSQIYNKIDKSNCISMSKDILDILKSKDKVVPKSAFTWTITQYSQFKSAAVL